jgi:Ca2+-binding EF-hand superfamily protein
MAYAARWLDARRRRDHRRQRHLPGAARGGARGSRASLNAIRGAASTLAVGDAFCWSRPQGAHHEEADHPASLGVLASRSVLAQTASRAGILARGAHAASTERAEAKVRRSRQQPRRRISQSEWQSARLREATEHFNKLDANRDGKLSREEMQQAREQRMGMRGHRGERGERLRALDKDGDQQLSRAEIGDSMPKLAENFDRLDGNRDGKLSREEIRAGRGERGEPAQR